MFGVNIGGMLLEFFRDALRETFHTEEEIMEILKIANNRMQAEIKRIDDKRAKEKAEDIAAMKKWKARQKEEERERIRNMR